MNLWDVFKQVKDLCTIVQGCSSDKVYYGRLVGFCVWVRAEVSLYVGFYENVYVYDKHKPGFVVVCAVAYVRYEMKIKMILIH